MYEVHEYYEYEYLETIPIIVRLLKCIALVTTHCLTRSWEAWRRRRRRRILKIHRKIWLKFLLQTLFFEISVRMSKCDEVKMSLSKPNQKPKYSTNLYICSIFYAVAGERKSGSSKLARRYSRHDPSPPSLSIWVCEQYHPKMFVNNNRRIEKKEGNRKKQIWNMITRSVRKAIASSHTLFLV